jgi:hypothetical protein
MKNPTELDNVSVSDILISVEERIGLLEQALNNIGQEAANSDILRNKSIKRNISLNSISTALVVDTIDPWKENRVRFFHPVLHDPTVLLDSLPFANPINPMGGFDDCGLNWVPPAGSTIMVVFKNGSLGSPYYLGTVWHRDRGAFATEFPYPIPEWAIYEGHRKGYFHGPGKDANNESQVLPPWNTENYNDLDLDQNNQFVKQSTNAVTFPHIYGFKTPEKHMIKMVDGDARCNRRWKRFEIMSSGGNWMMFKDDHLHYGGQWAHPSCPPDPALGSDKLATVNFCNPVPFYTDIKGIPFEKTDCNGCVQTNPLATNVNDSSAFQHSSTPGDPPDPPHKYHRNQGGSNITFKHKNECRPYKGPGTPQNNRCDLPQTGIQFLSISGHTFVMDDSVEEPSGKPEWERSLEPFDFGCNDKYLGLMYMKSATGHALTMCDMEETSKVRGYRNFVELRSANGSFIQLNDETIKGQQSDSQGCEGQDQKCPPDHAGPRRGVHIHSTSNHKIKLIDHMNMQCSPCRKEGGEAKAKATNAYMLFQSGYGLEMRFDDAPSQEKTESQSIQILHPQCAGGSADPNCNSSGAKGSCGPHILRFQGRPLGTPGMVFLRAGGYHVRQTYDADVVIVGDKEKNPSDKFTYVSKKHLRISEDIDYRYTGQSHVLFAEENIILGAGRDCPPPTGGKCKSPCLYNVVVSRCPTLCPLTGIIHWTDQSVSERVFASAKHECQAGCGGSCGDYNNAMANAGGKGCVENSGVGQEVQAGQEAALKALDEFLPTS